MKEEQTPIVDLSELGSLTLDDLLRLLPDGYVQVWYREECHPQLETALWFDPGDGRRYRVPQDLVPELEGALEEFHRESARGDG